MTPEHEYIDLDGKVVTSVLVDLEHKLALINHGDELLGMLRLTAQGLIFHAAIHGVASKSPPEADVLPESAAPEPVSTEEAVGTVPEKDKPVTLQGKLKSKPREGRPDRTGKPTAWARFAAHEEDQNGAHLYSTTFHRHTVEIALSLEKDTSLTVQGYPHLQNDPTTKRMDTLSVINLLDYPGKPERT